MEGRMEGGMEGKKKGGMEERVNKAIPQILAWDIPIYVYMYADSAFQTSHRDAI